MDVIPLPGFKEREIDFVEKKRILRIISHESRKFVN